jgi:hypothetical protein
MEIFHHFLRALRLLASRQRLVHTQHWQQLSTTNLRWPIAANEKALTKKLLRTKNAAMEVCKIKKGDDLKASVNDVMMKNEAK